MPRINISTRKQSCLLRGNRLQRAILPSLFIYHVPLNSAAIIINLVRFLSLEKKRISLNPLYHLSVEIGSDWIFVFDFTTKHGKKVNFTRAKEQMINKFIQVSLWRRRWKEYIILVSLPPKSKAWYRRYFHTFLTRFSLSTFPPRAEQHLLFPNHPHLHACIYRLHSTLALGKSGDSISPRLLSSQRNCKE